MVLGFKRGSGRGVNGGLGGLGSVNGMELGKLPWKSGVDRVSLPMGGGILDHAEAGHSSQVSNDRVLVMCINELTYTMIGSFIMCTYLLSSSNGSSLQAHTS